MAINILLLADESSGVSQSHYTTPTTTNTSGSATAIGNSVYGNAKALHMEVKHIQSLDLVMKIPLLLFR